MCGYLSLGLHSLGWHSRRLNPSSTGWLFRFAVPLHSLLLLCVAALLLVLGPALLAEGGGALRGVAGLALRAVRLAALSLVLCQKHLQAVVSTKM